MITSTIIENTCILSVLFPVVSVTTCVKNPCQMKAEVYSNTPVQISWSLDVNASVSTTENVITSTTAYFNYTAPVLLNVSGGGGMWSQDITLGKNYFITILHWLTVKTVRFV